MKLKEQNVLDWLMAPKEGFSLSSMIATTFTLNPTVLLELAGRMACCRSGGQKWKNEKMLRLALLEDVVSAKKDSVQNTLTVFSDDQIIPTAGLPTRYTKLLNGYYLPKCVCRIKMKNKGSFFHPKLLIAHFSNEKENVIRVAVLSKNLTLGSSVIEVCALFETTKVEQVSVSGKELAEFLRSFLVNKDKVTDCEHGTSLSREEALTRITPVLTALDGMQLRYIVPEGYAVPSKVSFYFVRPEDKTAYEYLEKDASNANGYVCGSDSISRSFWENLPAQKPRYLLSNLRSWGRFFNSLGTIPNPNEVFYSFYRKNEEDTYAAKTVHAKVAVFYGDKRVVWMGSANFTENGFSKNYEAGVRLEYESVNGGSPNPCLISIDSTDIAQPITEEKLAPYRTEDSLRQLIQSIHWSCNIEKENLVFRGEICAGSDIALLEKYRQFCLFTGNVIRLEYERGIAFSAETALVKHLIPWYGRAVLICFENNAIGSEPVQIPISITVEQSGGEPIKQPMMGEVEVSNSLLRGVYELIDLIPAEPAIAPTLYDDRDTFDVRLAKFICKGGSIEQIKTRIGAVKKALGFAMSGDAEEEAEEDMLSEEDMGMTEAQKKHFLGRLENLESFLED